MKGAQKLGKRHFERTKAGRETESSSIEVLQQSCNKAICVVYSSSSSIIEEQTAPRQRCCNRAATELCA